MAGSSILVIGATGRLGQHMAQASAAAGHPTCVLVRSETLSNPGPTKAALLDEFKNLGITILEGTLDDRKTLVAALKKVQVVIAAVGEITKQLSLIEAIKEAGTIKRFVPSEFSLNPDRATILPRLQKFLEKKTKVRREIEKAGIPYTYVTSCAFASIFLATFWHLENPSPPKDKIEFFGDGELNVPFVFEQDIAAYTIKTVDDPRTLNKVLNVRPKLNLMSPKQVVSLWEKKLGHPLEKTHLSEEKHLEIIAEYEKNNAMVDYLSMGQIMEIWYAIFYKGDLDLPLLPNEVEVTDLYPDIKYKTVEEFLDSCL